MFVAFYITFIYVWKLGTVFPQPNCSMTQLTHSGRALWTLFSLSPFFFIIFLSLFNFSFSFFFFCILNCWQANCQLNVQQQIMRSTRGRSLFCSYSARHFNYLQINSAHCVYEALAPTKNSITRINNNNNSITCQAARCVANWRRYKSQD